MAFRMFEIASFAASSTVWTTVAAAGLVTLVAGLWCVYYVDVDSDDFLDRRK